MASDTGELPCREDRGPDLLEKFWDSPDPRQAIASWIIPAAKKYRYIPCVEAAKRLGVPHKRIQDQARKNLIWSEIRILSGRGCGARNLIVDWFEVQKYNSLTYKEKRAWSRERLGN